MNSDSNSNAGPLTNVGWRLRHSAWLLAPILGCGILSWVGFVYVAARTGKRRWWIYAAVYAVLGMGSFIAFGLDEGADGALADISLTILLIVWLGGMVHAIGMNRTYLRWRATARPWYFQSHEAGTTHPGTTNPGTAVQAADTNPWDLDTTAYYGPTPPPQAPTAPTAPTAPVSAPPSPPPVSPQPKPAMVDVNTALSQQIATLPGLDDVWASHIVEVRLAKGGFADVDEFVSATGLQPHQFAKLRQYVELSPRQQQTHQRPPTRGRILDI